MTNELPRLTRNHDGDLLLAFGDTTTLVAKVGTPLWEAIVSAATPPVPTAPALTAEQIDEMHDRFDWDGFTDQRVAVRAFAQAVVAAAAPSHDRRLAACWNACAGLSTESLERLGTLDRARVQQDVIRAQTSAQAAAITKERA